MIATALRVVIALVKAASHRAKHLIRRSCSATPPRIDPLTVVNAFFHNFLARLFIVSWPITPPASSITVLAKRWPAIHVKSSGRMVFPSSVFMSGFPELTIAARTLLWPKYDAKWTQVQDDPSPSSFSSMPIAAFSIPSISPHIFRTIT